MKKRETIYGNIINLLFKNIELRDNNSDLWYQYAITFCGLKDSTPSIIQKQMIDKKIIPSVDTVTRLSRDIQFKYPLLRGLEWEKRQRKQVKAKEDLGYK